MFPVTLSRKCANEYFANIVHTDDRPDITHNLYNIYNIMLTDDCMLYAKSLALTRLHFEFNIVTYNECIDV